MNRSFLITSKTTSASVDEFLAKVLKAAATSVTSVGSKCSLSVFYIGKLPVFFLYTNVVSPRGLASMGGGCSIFDLYGKFQSKSYERVGKTVISLLFFFQTRGKFDFQTKVSNKFAADSILHKGLLLRR